MACAALAGALALFLGLTLRAQQSPRSQLDTILSEIHAGGIRSEMDAFNQLLAFRGAQLAKYPDLRPAARLGFIEILESLNANARAENAQYWAALLRAGPEGASTVPSPARPGEGAFLGNAIQVVAGLQDPRSIQSLLDDIETGNMATKALAGFGDQTVPPLLARLHASSIGTTVCASADPRACLQELHAAALRALTQMAAPAIFTKLAPHNQAIIRNLIVSAIRSMPLDVRHGGNRAIRQGTGLQGAGLLGDRSLEPLLLRVARGALNPMIRMDAVISLGDLRDPSLQPALQKIAASDQYPDVRQAARYALNKLGSNP